jgi:hypothetical protein
MSRRLSLKKLSYCMTSAFQPRIPLHLPMAPDSGESQNQNGHTGLPPTAAQLSPSFPVSHRTSRAWLLSSPSSLPNRPPLCVVQVPPEGAPR